MNIFQKNILIFGLAGMCSLSAHAQTTAALLSAAQYGKTSSLTKLLNNGANVNAKNKNGITALMVSADNGDVKTTDLLLKYHAKVNVVDAKGNSAIFYAAGKGHTPVMKKLLAAKSRVNKQNEQGQTSLHWAVQNDQEDPIQLLLQYNAYMEFEDENGYTPALLAAANGKTTSLETLHKAGANLQAKDHKGNTAFDLALQNDHLQTVRYLLETKAASLDPHSVLAQEILFRAAGLEDPQEALALTECLLDNGVLPPLNATVNNPLQAAIQANNSEVAARLLQVSGSDINAHNIGEEADTLLINAIKRQDANAVKTLLAAGADPNARSGLGRTPLATLLDEPTCQADILEQLLEAGANPNEPLVSSSTLMTPLAVLQSRNSLSTTMDLSDAAAAAKYTDGCIQILQEQGGISKLSKKDESILNQEKYLFNAARSGKTEEIAYLLAGGLSVNTIDEKGNTPLMEAARKGQVNAVKQLLQAGANVDMRNIKGETALTIAAANKRTAVFKPLMDANVTDTLGALTYATDSGNVKLVKALAQAGVDIDQQTDGMTVLMSAIKNKQNKRAATLINAGADIHALADDYNNALYCAWAADNMKMVRLLEKNGAYLTPQGEQKLRALNAQKTAAEMLNTKITLD